MLGRDIAVRKTGGLPAWRSSSPWLGLHQGIDRMFERALRDWGTPELMKGTSMVDFVPEIDVEEDEKEIRVVAELPGIDEKDIEVSVDHDQLTIRGKKESETKEEGKGFYRRERSFGSFERVIALPSAVDETKIEARAKKGVVTIHLPKSAEEKEKLRKIPVLPD